MKSWYQSKTFWVNATVAALTTLEASTDLLQPFLPVNFYVIVAVGLPVINAVLRIIATHSLTKVGNDA